LAETEALFKKAIAINPTESRAYFRLGCLYQIEARYHEAEQTWIKGLEKNPGNYYISSKLLQLYTQEKRSQEAEKIFQRTFSTDAKNYEIYLELGDHSRVDAHSPDTDDKLKGKLPSEIKGYIKLTDRMAIYQKATIDNYRNLRTILLDRGVKLIVVQYPCRSIEPLKHIFENKEGIIFVDNENSFKDALKHGDYKEYFNDCFAGDFGHCTRKGNRLLADNIAKAIIQAER
jgi:tetratricopeptide (TPR) repeat protein